LADIFFSYTSSDRDWAYWVGHELKALGHTPRIHDWEIPAGGDIMAWMEERHHEADHVLCIVSEVYLKKPYSSLERRAALWAALTTRPNFLLPIFTEPCEVPTLFATLKRCALHGLAEEDARARLKAYLAPAEPSSPSPFPGAKVSPPPPSSTAPPPFPGKADETSPERTSRPVPQPAPAPGVLRDDQYYRRKTALKNFAALWLVLDQLPQGCWGRSTAHWMSNVWHDVPGFAPNIFIEEEGGFESTILNLEIAYRVFGPTTFGGGTGLRAIKYIQRRSDPGGYGPFALAREGFVIDAHYRHTALVGWLFGTVLKDLAIQREDYARCFTNSAKAIFDIPGTDFLKGARDERLDKDRNPVMLYLAAWHVVKQLDDPAWQRQLELAQVNPVHLKATWATICQRLQDRALATEYSASDGKPAHLVQEHGVLFPLVMPYAGFVRLEGYSLLSASTLLHHEMPENVRMRMVRAIDKMVSTYEADWPDSARYNVGERLQPIHRGPRPFYSGPDRASPDLGTAAMLFRVLRTHDIWSRGIVHPDTTKKWETTSNRLMEDLVDLFDRYQLDQSLYDLTHAGMLAAVLVPEVDSLRAGPHFERVSKLARTPPSSELTSARADEVLGEKTIDSLIETVVADCGPPPGIQLSERSLSKLLLDRVNPGRYIQQGTLELATARAIVNDTIAIYNDLAFAEKFTAVWGASHDSRILAPFLQLLPDRSSVLDVGCGPGQYAVQFARAGHQVTLLDASAALLSEAKKRVRAVTKRVPRAFPLVSLIDCYVVQLSQVFMLRVFPVGTNY
jgi:TIR domain/Methyltransferase domain